MKIIFFILYIFINLHFFEKEEIKNIEKDWNNSSKKPNKDGIIIGILTLDTSDNNLHFDKKIYNMIPSSYVKWVQEMGVRVIPINYTEDFSLIEKKLEKINGILFTGGSASLFEQFFNKKM